MPIIQDIGSVLGQVGNNLFGNIKEEFEKAKNDSISTRNIQPMVDFYKKNEAELKARGFDINDLLSKITQGYISSESDIIYESNNSNNNNKNNNSNLLNFAKEFALPILGLIAGGAAILILIKTLK